MKVCELVALLQKQEQEAEVQTLVYDLDQCYLHASKITSVTTFEAISEDVNTQVIDYIPPNVVIIQ
jgi:hypothetical protein